LESIIADFRQIRVDLACNDLIVEYFFKINIYFQEILERTKYSHDVSTGQRKYGGPPPDWTGVQPGAGHEVMFTMKCSLKWDF